MSSTRNQDFIRGTDGRQARVVNGAATAVLAVAVAALIGVVWVHPHVDEPEGLVMNIEMPYVGPGVGTGTKVVLHGAEVGEVTALGRTGLDSVRMTVTLAPAKIDGLTDSFEVDFRPQNYFGITAVDLVDRPGGDALVAGRTLSRTPRGDFTMSTMLEKGSVAIDGSLTTSMVRSLDKVVRYTDGLTPLIRSGIVFADRVAATQQALPTELLRYANDILAVLPAFSAEAIDSLGFAYDSVYNRKADGSRGVDDAFMDYSAAGLGLAANSLFGKAGTLLASHGAELTPSTLLVKALIDALPHMLDGGAAPAKLRELIDRYTAVLSASGPGKTLGLRIVLDELPMVAAPLAVTGVVPDGPR
ncbi:MlaD family protein [Nocardia bovistercoris]|uniref:Mce family protein n=1 Tax=Nocardia bovistercoris TaxID=2785916 RepID=A0A931N3U5_9NOCA|nr:Mce family protein [Nocardia bovistercoris]MBH0781025.1 Mce family protein [Nocardia bovistercoris]